MRSPAARLYLGCFLRSYFVGAAYNPQGLQNIGFFHALDPALRALFRDEGALREARLRHARWFNCHPFFTPMLLGVLLRMEAAIARGQLDPAVLSALKDTTANTLSAIGDSFFNGTLLSTWALSASCLILTGHPLAAVVLTTVIFVLLQLFKLVTFIMGVRKGMAVLALLKKLDLASWSVRLKYGNATLLCWLLWLALPDSTATEWTAAAAVLLGAGWIVGRIHISRIFVAVALFALIAAVHWYDGSYPFALF